ncbi:hypothetical protein [Crocosphaera sp. XPORK-15E]|uniref:hypothetical protein n=1 Tax=Crocosphaera sp. XPORK-15E TaxID=3110247 RepID=UPI002B20E2BF|nr:hypothetical protein [Crocosphaera sp. XPORK-15E]MEA5535047.1 hypothetical protein [Crocosphaera sp. XPORK-15E]
MLEETIHILSGIAVIIALWAMKYNDISSKILITLYVIAIYIMTHYSKKIFNQKISDNAVRDKQIYEELHNNHQLTIKAIEDKYWNQLEIKTTEINLCKEQIARLDQIIKIVSEAYKNLIKVSYNQDINTEEYLKDLIEKSTE